MPRAKVISALRQENGGKKDAAIEAASSPGSSRGDLSPYPKPHRHLPEDLIRDCVEFFFDKMYPTQPILHRKGVEQMVEQMPYELEAFCAIKALCAYMMIQPNMPLSNPTDSSEQHALPLRSHTDLGTTLLSEALEARKGIPYFENPTTTTVITSFFFFGCHFCLEKHSIAWFHLREATTVAVLIGMHLESSYKHGDALELKLERRLFWLLFVTERAYALQTQKPLTLHDTIQLPEVDEDPTEAVTLTGFMHLISLFRPFDDTFVGIWNESGNDCNVKWIIMLQKQLSEALPLYLQSTETQAVDLKTSQHWLRMMTWQLSISHKLLSSMASDESMTFTYPIKISQRLLNDTAQFSQQAMEVHGIGLVKKLFDVACTLIDVISCVPIEQDRFGFGPSDYLNQMLLLIKNLRGGEDRYFPLLLARAAEVLPQAPITALPTLPVTWPDDSESGGESKVVMTQDLPREVSTGVRLTL
ncbi:MAG: hypothetical protein M1831_002231 [Alyxoria varia]|nr:MAG: hypothetical protein M1831_002231 [Alyxoria varia]